jgi:hypothetical protein
MTYLLRGGYTASSMPLFVAVTILPFAVVENSDSFKRFSLSLFIILLSL